MATDHNFKVKNGLHVEGANTKIVDAGSGNVKLETGGTLSIRPEGTTSNKHFFELNDYTAAGNVGAATLSATGNITVGGNVSLSSNSKHIATRSLLARDTNGLAIGTTNATTAISIDNSANVTIPQNLTVTGNLTINGTSTTLNTATLTVDDKKITIADGAGSSANANESGFEIGVGAVGASSNPSILYYNTGTLFESNQNFKISAGKVLRANTVNSAANDANIIYRSSTNTIVGNNTTALVVQDGGKVGVGTASPARKLQVTDTTTTSGEVLYLKGHSSGGAGIVYSRNDSFTWHAGVGGGSGTGSIPLSFFGIVNKSQSTLPFVIAHTTGNVGIGDSSPGFKLAVRTPAIPSGSSYAWPLDLSRPNTDSRGLTFGIGASGGNHVIAAHNGDVGIGHTYGVDSNGLPQYYETMRFKHVDGSNFGLIGVGTTVPEAQMELYKIVDGDAQNLLIMNQKSYGVGTGTNERASINLGIAEASQTSLSRLFGNIHVRTNSESDSSHGTLSFGVRGSGAIRDDVLVIKGFSSTDQRVGIGVSSPDTKLHVNGSAIRVGPSSAPFADFKPQQIYATAAFSFASGNNSFWHFANASNASQVSIDVGNTRVGIGASSPSVALDVVGGANFYSGTTSNTLNIGRSATERLKIDVDDGNITLTADQDADGNSTHNFILDRTFDGSGASQFQIKNNGSLQFNMSATEQQFYNGTTYFGTDDGAAAMLHVFGAGAGTAEGGELRLYTSADHDSSYNWYRIDAYQDDLRIGRAGQTDLTIDHTGQVIFGGDITLANEKDIHFLKADGTNDSTKLTRAGGNALRLKFAGNALIFDALDDNDFRVYNSAGDNIFQVNTNSTASSSTVDIVNGALRMGASPVITHARVLQNVTANANIITAGTMAAARVSGDYSIRSTSTSGQLKAKDDRIIEPNSIDSRYLQFGFTSFDNDNGSPYADYLHMRSYQDASGGSDNLLMFSKSSIAARVYQQSWNSSTAYSSYKNIVMTDIGNNEVTFQDHFKAGDNIRLKLGASADLNLYHASSNSRSYITGGDIEISTNSFRLFNLAGSGGMIQATTSGITLTPATSITGDVVIGSATPAGTHALKVYHTDNFEAAKFETNQGGSLARFTDSTAASVEFGIQSGNAVIRTANSSRISVNSSGVITFNSAYAFPTADGSSGQVLKTDGSGALTFQNDTSATFTGGDVASAINFTPDTGTFLSVDGQAILQRMTANGALTIGHDDHVIIAGGDTSTVLNTNLTNANEEVTLGSEGGVRMLAFPSNNTTWSNRKELKWDGTNGLQILNSMPLKMGSDIILDSTHGFSSKTSDGKFYAWSPVTNTSSQTNNYIKIATLNIGQSARFSIELQGRSTSYGDGQFPSWGKIVGQVNNDDNIDATFYDFTSGQNSDASKVVNNIYTKFISSGVHEVWVHVDSFSELGATGQISTGHITVHSNNTGQTTSAPASIVTVTKIEMWNSNNDGPGSGLNADTLDGVSSEEFLRSNADDSYSGNITFTGSGSSGNAFTINRGGNTQQQAFRVNNTGEVIVSANYLYAAHTGTAFYSQGGAVFRGGLSNDTGGEDLWLNDNVSIGRSDSNKVTTLFVGSDAVTTDDSGLRFRLNGTYADGRYEHRFRKRDEGGGIPLYIDKTEGTAGSHTAIARFGLYSGHGDEFEVYGGGKMTRLTTADGINDAGSAGSTTVFNENGTTADFRIESDSNTHMFALDGGLNRIGINNSSPSTTLDVIGDTTITGELNISNKLRHVGDTDTYLQFQGGGNSPRIVSGNNEITEWRSDRMQMTNKPITFSNWSNFSDDALTDINYATLNAPIHIPAVNIGTNNKYLPILQASAQHTQGYRSQYVFGAYKKGTTGAAWGDGQSGFFMGMGGNDNNPTKEFRFSWDGRIWYTDAGDDTWIDFDTDSHIKFVTSGVHRGEFDDGGINIVSGGYQTSGITRIDTAGKFFPASINSTGKISVLNGSSAQGIRVATLYAGTTYNNDGSASGMVDTLNGYRVQGSQRIDSSGNFFAGDYINIGDDAAIEDYNVANSIRIKGIQDTNQGYIAFGQQTAKLGVNNSSTLTYNSNFAVTGNITSTATIQCGTGSGGVGLTVNDGQGNANVTFNHVAGIPEQAGNCGRIVVNTDATTGAQMNFELVSNSGTSTINTPSAMNLTEDGLHIAQYLYHLSDTDTYIRMTADRIRIAAGGVVKFDTNTFNTFNALVVGGGNSNASIYRTTADCSGFHFTTNAVFPTGNDGQLNNGVVDLGSTSYRYKDIHLGGRAYLSGQSAVNLSVDGGYFEVTSASGYVRMGAGNTSYSHFHTDRPQFYFNKKIVVDEGIVQSYDEDLILRRAGSSNDQITLTGSEVKFANTYHLRLFDSSGTSGGCLHMAREGAISFYGDQSMNHSIGARNSDDIRLNTYGAFLVNLDSNGNNGAGTADFTVGRHAGATSAFGTSDILFRVAKDDGDVTAKGDVTAFNSFSDIRLKENVEVIADPLAKVLKLKGITFNYKDSGKRSTGLIAQDLEEVLPEAVYETEKLGDKETTVKAVRYGNTVGLLVEAIKEQQTIINRLEERINKLEGENNGD